MRRRCERSEKSRPISQRRRSCLSTDAALASANVQAVRQWTMRFVDAIEAERLTPLVDADAEIDRDDVDGAWSPTLRWLALQLAATSERRFPLRFSKFSFVVLMMMNDCLFFFVSSTSAVGALLFLRLICPALTTPVESGLLPPSNATTAAATTATQKALVTISKILQTLANQVLFCLFFLSLLAHQNIFQIEFKKEPHMMPFNALLREQVTFEAVLFFVY